MNRRKRIRIAAFAVALAGVSATWAIRPVQTGLALPPEKPMAAERLTLHQPDTRLAFAPAFGERRIYPYSVIPGGISSVESLRDIVEHNPEIAQHLRDFDLQHAKVVQVTAPRAVYVSYRIGANIFWTTKRLTLARGESLVTDGTRTLRGRCGNDVSDVAVEPTSDEEPPIADLDTPLSLPQVDGQADLDSLPILAYVPPESTFDAGPTWFVPPVGSSTGSTSTPPTGSGSLPSGSSPPPFLIPPFGPPGNNAPVVPTPPVSTPEPSTLLLMLFGAAGLGARRFWGKRK